MSKQDQAASFFTGFLIGGLIGAATALILAPQSGEETRSQIRDRSIELKDKAETTYADLQKKVEATVADLREKVDELSVRVDEVISQGKEKLAQKVPQKDKASSEEKVAAE